MEQVSPARSRKIAIYCIQLDVHDKWMAGFAEQLICLKDMIYTVTM